MEEAETDQQPLAETARVPLENAWLPWLYRVLGPTTSETPVALDESE